ncbi:hypothetical protein PEC301877_02190 [Pectobacterium carotovorum subsp. carotovorum]|nr:hypothetical protein PEC301877_02190 [Pectobacterium carotovorum subsp. carotovorum]
MRNNFLYSLDSIDLDEHDYDYDFICLECIEDSILKLYDRKLHHERICCECHKKINSGFSVSYLTSKFKENLSCHYEVVSDSSGIPLFDVVLSFLGKKEISNRVTESLLKTIDKLDKYKPIKDNVNEIDAINKWNEINYDLMYSSRFFNKSVESYFSEIVSLAYHHVGKSNNKERLAVSQLAKGSKLYRARKILIDEREDILTYPAQRLGPAPYNKAANNRMSAESISMLYLAKDQETSISEMRPSMGDVLAVGEFITTKDLVFFDFYKIEKEIQGYIYGKSILFKRNERQYIIEKILPFIGNEICRPANNPSGYIASQALAEVIKNFHNGNFFDGIIFKSVQNDAGVNYVIFNKSQYKEGEEVSCEDFFVEINRDVISFNRITSIKYKSEEA